MEEESNASSTHTCTNIAVSDLSSFSSTHIAAFWEAASFTAHLPQINETLQPPPVLL